MVISYDKFMRAEPPALTLCNPNCTYNSDTGSLSNPVGQLTGAYDIELVLNFNQISELHFAIVKNVVGDNVFAGVQNRRIVFVAGYGFFIINNTETSDSDDGVMKTITAISCEAELMRKTVPLYNNETAYSLAEIFSMLSVEFPGWILPTADDIPAEVASRHRVFEDIDVTENIYAFIFSDMQVVFGCVFDVDRINRRLICYDSSTYIQDSEAYIPCTGLANNITIARTSEDVRTALTVYGENDLSIEGVNPIGGNTVYDFSHFYDQMSSALSQKAAEWQNDIAEAEDEYSSICQSIYQKSEAISSHELERDRLDTIISVYSNMKDTLTAGSDKKYTVESFNATLSEIGNARTEYSEYEPAEMDYDQTIEGIVAAIDTQLASAGTSKTTELGAIETLTQEREVLKASRDAVVNTLSIGSYFTDDERDELSAYIIDEYWNYEYATSTASMTLEQTFNQMSILYSAAKDHLSEVSSPTVQVSGDMKLFPFSAEFRRLSENITLGRNLLDFELYDGSVIKLLPMSITLSFDSKGFSITFANRIFKTDNRTLYEDLFGEISRSSNTVSREKTNAYPVVGARFDRLQSAATSALNINLEQAISATDNAVIIDGSGYLGVSKSDAGDSDKQIKITNNSIVFTKDGWETASLAIGPVMVEGDAVMYGINAEVVYGKLIAGVRLSVGESDKALSRVLSDMNAEITDDINQISSWMTFDENNGLTIGEYVQDPMAVTFFVRHKAREYSMFSTRSSVPIIKLDAKDAAAKSKIISTDKRVLIGNYAFEALSSGVGIKYNASEE